MVARRVAIVTSVMMGTVAALGFGFVGSALVGASMTTQHRFFLWYPLLSILAIGGATGVSGWFARSYTRDAQIGCSVWVRSLVITILLFSALMWVTLRGVIPAA